MRFVSKSTNYHLILSPGLPGNHVLGTANQPAISVKFVNGIADIHDQRIQEMVMAHPSFGSDFVSVEEVSKADPFSYLRKGVQPQHQMIDMQYGAPGKVTKGVPASPLPPAIEELIRVRAVAMMKEMAPELEQARKIVSSFDAALASNASTKQETPEPNREDISIPDPIEKEEPAGGALANPFQETEPQEGAPFVPPALKQANIPSKKNK
jgi:hypothetical protein